jgi:signal peptide peptidase SppA
MSMHLHRVASQFYNRPLLVLPSTAETISSFLLSRIGAGPLGDSGENDSGESVQTFSSTAREDGSREYHSPRASRFYGDYPVDPESNGRPRPYRRTPDGTAIITMVGELVNRGAWVGASSGLISYEGIKFQLRTAANDTRVRNVILDMESPGGEAVGAFEVAQSVRELAAQKPVTAVVDGMAASAGYAIASGARDIVTIPSGLSGSIGVVMMHLDFSAWLEDNGIKPTLIFAGDHKVDGNPFEPLPADVRNAFQQDVSSFYDQFVQTVALGRPNLSEDEIRGTQARVYKGEDAVKVGLADRVGTFDQVLAELSQQPARSRAQPKGKTMNDKTGAPAANATGTVTEMAEVDTGAIAADAGKAAQTRIKSILGSDESKGRADLANHLAFETDMSAEAAVALLAKSPKGAAAAATPSIAQRQDLALGGVSERQAEAKSTTAADLNPSAIYQNRRKAVGK